MPMWPFLTSKTPPQTLPPSHLERLEALEDRTRALQREHSEFEQDLNTWVRTVKKLSGQLSGGRKTNGDDDVNELIRSGRFHG